MFSHESIVRLKDSHSVINWGIMLLFLISFHNVGKVASPPRPHPRYLVQSKTCVDSVSIGCVQALKAAVHNYSVAVVSFWDQIFGVVVGVIDLSTDGCSGATEVAQMTLSSFAKSAQATASAQTARLSDDKLVQCAIKVCMLCCFLNLNIEILV